MPATPLSWAREPLDRRLCAPTFRWVCPFYLYEPSVASRLTRIGSTRTKAISPAQCNARATIRNSLELKRFPAAGESLSDELIQPTVGIRGQVPRQTMAVPL